MTAALDEDRSPKPARALSGAALGLCAILAIETALRVSFRWDLLVWSESPFMTDMLKLAAGEPLYGPPADASSFVYSPGLALLTHAMLSPLGLSLDIRACRVVTILFGVAAAVGLAWVALRVLGDRLSNDARDRRLGWTFSVCLSLLVVFRNFTADVPHPDNLQLAHLVATLLLGWLALEHESFTLALGCVLFAGFGVLAKQVGALVCIGAGAALVWRGRWSLRRRIALAVAALVSGSVCLGSLLADPRARFYLFRLLAKHPLGPWPGKLEQLGSDLVGQPILVLVPLLGIAGALALWRSSSERARDFVAIWATLGVFGALPSLSAYVKYMGQWNNFGVVTALCVATALPGVLLPTMGLARDESGASKPARGLPLVLPWLLLVWLFPLKLHPGDDATAACEALDRAIAEDVQRGRRVLLAHGTMPLVRAGVREPPLDRANSVLELGTGGKLGLVGTIDRIERGYYDAIYLNSWWLRGPIEEAIRKAYRFDRSIPPAGRVDFRTGNQGLMAAGVEIFRKKEALRPVSPERAGLRR